MLTNLWSRGMQNDWVTWERIGTAQSFEVSPVEGVWECLYTELFTNDACPAAAHSSAVFY